MRILVMLFTIHTFFIGSVISQDLIPYNNNGKWGYADKNMNVIIPCIFDYALPFYEDRALVVIYNDSAFIPKREYFIDKTGKIVFGLLSKATNDFNATRFQYGMSLVDNFQGVENSVSLVDKNGTEIKRIDSASMGYEMGIKAYTNSFNDLGFYVTNFHDSTYHSIFVYNDKKIKKMSYININNFKGSYASAYSKPFSLLVDKNGKIIVKSENNQLLSCTEGLVRFADNEQKYGFLNLKGKLVIKPEYDYSDDFSEGLAVFGIIDPDGDGSQLLYGYINKKGKVVLPAIYRNAFNFSDGLADVVIGDSLFFIDKKGKKVLRFRTNSDYDMFDFTHGFRNGVAIIIQNNKFSWIDKKGNYIIQPLYIGSNLGSPVNTVYDFDAGITLVNLPNQTECFIDEEGIPYYEKPYSILCKSEKSILYKAMNKDSLSNDYLDRYDRLIYIKKFNGKFINSSNPKTEWIEIDGPYVKGFVLAKDFYNECYSVSNKKGTKIYRDEKSETVLNYLPFRFQLHSEKEIPNFDQLSDNARVPLIYFDSFYYTEEEGYKTVYIKKGDIEKMEKPN